MSRVNNQKSRIGTVLHSHIANNKREYLIIAILFFIGLILSIIVINNTNDETIMNISIYLNDLVKKIKDYENIDLLKILNESIVHNITIAVILWFGASTIIGIPIVYGIIILKGFSIGCTISSFLAVFGTVNGTILSVSFMLLHNIIYIPSMFAISVSGVKLYKSIMKNKQRENIKLEILRHTVFCMIMLIGVLISSIIETYISTNISIILLNYIKI